MLLRSLRPLWSSETGRMRTRRPRPAPVPRSEFAGFRFPPDVIVLAVRWYLRFGLSYRDVEELLTERGTQADHVTIYRPITDEGVAVRGAFDSDTATGMMPAAQRVAGVLTSWRS